MASFPFTLGFETVVVCDPSSHICSGLRPHGTRARRSPHASSLTFRTLSNPVHSVRNAEPGKTDVSSHRTTWADRRISAGSVLLRAEYVPIRAARRCYYRSSFGSSLFVIYLEQS